MAQENFASGVGPVIDLYRVVIMNRALRTVVYNPLRRAKAEVVYLFPQNVRPNRYKNKWTY